MSEAAVGGKITWQLPKNRRSTAASAIVLNYIEISAESEFTGNQSRVFEISVKGLVKSESENGASRTKARLVAL